MTSKTVAIIGAGASGLATAKVLLEDGFDVTIFERQKTIGGIWSPDWAYADLHTQQLAGFMSFSNLHDPNTTDNAPWQEIHNYLKTYAEKFHLIERIQFQTNVLLIDKTDLRDSNLPWTITVETTNGKQQTFEFDFVVIAIGLFSTPYKPIFRGEKKFTGLIVHANEIKTYEQLKNKRVIIVGGGKSALDLATLAAKYAHCCYMIFRRAHWFIPQTILHGYLPTEYSFTRLFTVIFDPFPYAPHSKLFYFIHRLFSSLFHKLFDSMSDDIISDFKSDLYQDQTLIPKGTFRNAENVMYITKEFLELNREGRIIRKLASVDEIISDTTIRLNTGDLIEADLIVCATGYIEKFPFLSNQFHRVLSPNSTILLPNDGLDLDLYRRIIPVGIPNIAFIGLPAASHTWMFFEVQCHWTSDYFLGRIKLPRTEKEMFEEIEITRNFIRKLFNRKSYYFQYYWLEPIEIYLQDMGVSLHRTNNWISEYFGVYRTKRIATLHQERQAKAKGQKISICHRHWYFGSTHTVLLFIFLLFIYYFFF